MAERTSSRAGSRRTTPQPAPQTARARTQSPAKRATRKTRSQSRDISDSEDGRIGLNARRGGKQATPNSTYGAVGPNASKSGKGKPTNQTRVQQDLSVVVEDPSVVYPDLETAEDRGAGEDIQDAGAGQPRTQPNDKSPGRLSAFSGTTARVSFPTQELIELSAEEMTDTLPDLSDASDKMLKFVIPTVLSEASVTTIMAQMRNNNTREHKKLKRLGDTFERQRKVYGGDSYINVGDTLRRLLGRKPSPINEQTASWRPDALFQKANLAFLVLQTLSIANQDQKDHFIEEVAGTFPLPFIQRLGHPQSLAPECSALAEATFELALEVRTQEAIMLLARHVGKINFDPDTALLQVFYDSNILKGWAVPGLRVVDLTKEAKDIILSRIKQLRGTFRLDEPMPSDGQSSGIESLRASFSWATFAQRIIAWAGQRLMEIEIQTTTYGGAQVICQRLSDMVQNGMLGQPLESDNVDNQSESPELRLDFEAQSESRATSEPQRDNALRLAPFSADSIKGKSAVAYLKQREAKRKATEASKERSLPETHGAHSIVQVASTAGPSVRSSTPQNIHDNQVMRSPVSAHVSNIQASSADQIDSWNLDNNGEEEEEEEDITIRRNSQASLRYRKQREAESNKENVAGIPESRQNRMANNRSIFDRDPLAERVAPIDSQDSGQNSQEIEISSDEGFQSQEDSSNATRQRHLKPATKRPALEPARPKRQTPKKVRVEENVDVHRLDDAGVARDEQEAEVHEQEAEAPLSQSHSEYVRANLSAKQRIAVVPKPPQSRTAWTSKETEMLHYLITEHGTSWKLLKNEDLRQESKLIARDQVALKDKARNMKMDYLKAGRVLPPNFERIPLSKPQIKRLRDGGIEYDPETGTRVDAEVID